MAALEGAASTQPAENRQIVSRSCPQAQGGPYRRRGGNGIVRAARGGRGDGEVLRGVEAPPDLSRCRRLRGGRVGDASACEQCEAPHALARLGGELRAPAAPGWLSPPSDIRLGA